MVSCKNGRRSRPNGMVFSRAAAHTQLVERGLCRFKNESNKEHKN